MLKKFTNQNSLVNFIIYTFTSFSTFGHEKKSLLIVNSYNDGEPWADEMVLPIVFHIATVDHVDCDIVSLNNASLPNIASFNETADHIFDDYSKKRPDFLVLVGNFAFNLRHRINKEWGDVPMLLISKIKETAPLERYFDHTTTYPLINPENQLSLKRDLFNFSAIIIPDYYEETVDMMVKLIPEMDELVFCSDSIYVNRHVSHGINDYIKRNYPNVKFRWLKANSSNADTLRQYFATSDPNIGLLMSSWYYDRKGLNGTSFVTSSDIKLISSSKNPVFSMREQYMNLGAVGGVFANDKSVKNEIIKMVDRMINGEDMRNVPFYIAHDNRPVSNYQQMKKYNLDPEDCPSNTIIIQKPETFIEKYLWQTIVSIAFLIIIIIALLLFISMQRKHIRVLYRNSNFISTMPVPYSSVKASINDNGEITKFDYTLKNAAFKKLISENVSDETLFLLFPSTFIVPKINTMLKTNSPVSFQYHFKKTNTYYNFILCPVHRSKHIDGSKTKIMDMFAVDTTHSHNMTKELIATARKLDITLEAAEICPFVLDTSNNTISFDIRINPNIKKSYRNNTSVENASSEYASETGKKQIVITIQHLYTTVHPEDLKKVIITIEKIRRGKIRDFKLEYRCKWLLDETNDDNYEDWVEVLGTLVESDPKTHKRIIVGSMQRITQRKKHEAELTEALARANESDCLKSAFLANMSHEIRTPLNAIVGFSNVIAQTEDPKERMEFCDIINRNNEQLLAIISDVLDFAKIEVNMIDISPEPCDINRLMNSIRQTISSKVPKEVNLNMILGKKNYIALIDPVRVTQVMTNLLTNACKFTTSGSISFGYELTNDEKTIHLFVKDSGRGITKEEQDKIFDRFYKADKFAPGTGLGLPICRSIVEKMGGVIYVHSDGLGKGTLIAADIPNITAQEEEETKNQVLPKV